MLKDFLPTALRSKLYVGYAAVALLLTAIQTGFAAAEVGQPVWLTVAWPVFGVIGAGIGATAKGNLTPEVEDGDGAHVARGGIDLHQK